MNIMNTLRSTYQKSIYQIRQFHKCIIQQTEVTAAATASTVSVSESVPTESHPAVSSKIEMIAGQIVNLNLIEVAQLSDLLKKKLNLPDAPVMPMGGFVASGPNVEVEEEPQVVQTAFTVKLTGFDEKQKIALIKELKSILPNCNLVQAKKFVESTPGVIKADIAKDEAEKLIKGNHHESWWYN
ncbi:39S ribosomal protein L12, mitochondrial [Melipona quadrifasciata]|uniref:39S ribosomal protein L12, mitochondrial n=1 Tax=Melipona quadrifasciata TaxID=166423 RepID=A0A0N0BIX7_9HYME|nr:39S ribosomal protein L12, mitochondrial [Melipona quadrifasciata]